MTKQSLEIIEQTESNVTIRFYGPDKEFHVDITMKTDDTLQDLINNYNLVLPSTVPIINNHLN